MPDERPMPKQMMKSRSLSREIAAALLVKIVLLWGIWYLAFHHGKPARPEIEDLFQKPRVLDSQTSIKTQENSNVIR